MIAWFARPALAALALAAPFLAGPAQAAPSLVIDANTGAILHQQEATASWFPASLTKLMTAYVALKAVSDGEITLDTPLLVSQRAARMAPSKMGFKPGTEVTLENALVMIMVKSANDVSVTIAEGIGGSVEGFAARMNAAARSLGMTQSSFRNPNGLPDREQVTSARDMALLALALEREFPQHRWMWTQGAMQLGQRYFKTHNGLVGRYPGADGMKTGFTCAAGFNVVASASRYGRRLITVVMGSPSARDRTALAAELFDKGFGGAASQGHISSLPASGIRAAEDQRGNVCVRRGRPVIVAEADEDLAGPLTSYAGADGSNPATEFLSVFSSGATARAAANGYVIAAREQPRFDPVIVHIGRKSGWTGRVAGPGAAAPPAVASSPRPVIGTPARPTTASATAGAPVQLPGAAAARPQGNRAANRNASKPPKPAPARAATNPAPAAQPRTTVTATPKPKPAPRPAARPVRNQPQASVIGAPTTGFH